MTGPKNADFAIRFPALVFAVFGLVGCSSQPRFVPVDASGIPFVMFDNRTAQSCYAGSREALEEHIQSIRRQADTDAVLDKPTAVAGYYFPENRGSFAVPLFVEMIRQSLEYSKKAAEEYREVERLTEIQKLSTCRSLLSADHTP